MMKMNKKQRRLVRRMMFPVIALVMMTATMAIAGVQQSPAAATAR